MKKRLFAILICLVLAVGMLPNAVFAAGEEHASHCICGRETAEAGGASHYHGTNTWTGISSLDEITGPGSYYLKSNVILGSAWEQNISGELYICLNGHDIVGANGSSVIINNGRLCITDCHSGSEVGSITHNEGETGRGIENHSYLFMYNGSITGNTLSAGNGAGVLNADYDKVFYMYGGSITNNTTVKTGDYDGRGGGVYNGSGSSFKMQGNAVISENSAESGGGVFNFYRADMYGNAAILNNTAETGGGVWNGGSSGSALFAMHDSSSIKGNTATTGYGGGVFTCDGYFDMESNASISNNTATSGVGGGVFHSGRGFEMNGGSITGNTAGSIFGGGLCSNSANPVGLRGKVTITGNTADGDPDNYFQSSDHIINASGLTEGSSIGVGVYFTRRPTGDSPLVLTDEGCNPEYFTADNYRYVIKASDTGEILLALPTVQHTHAWSATWASDADAHWHVCTAPGCTVTQNSQKSGYAPHVYDKEIVADNYKKSDATEDSAAVYYKSCICGAKGTETFTHGSPLPPSHTHTANTEKWESNGETHWNPCTGEDCGEHLNEAAHSFEWKTDREATESETGLKHEECTVCGAKRSENTQIDKLPSSGESEGESSGESSLESEGESSGESSVPRTGDSGSIALSVLLMLICCAAVGATAAAKKRSGR